MDTLMMTLLVAMFTAAPAHSNQGPVPAQLQLASNPAQTIPSAAAHENHRDCKENAAFACARKTEAAKFNGQRGKMKSCNKQAADKNLKGYNRIDFISSCVQE